MGTAVQIRTSTPTFHQVLRNAPIINGMLKLGYYDGFHGVPCSPAVIDALAAVRGRHGFVAKPADLLTPPSAQHKLNMAAMPSYGLTLAHADISGHELCPWRTPGCTATCVLNNGNGRYDSVQRAWKWRTDFFLTEPARAAFRLGWELGRAVRHKGRILFRPDVNSDVAWHTIMPAMGELSNVVVYGYTKNPAILSRTDQLADSGFHYAYSWNERSNMSRVQDHLIAGGKLAVVTNRRKGQPVDRDALQDFFQIRGVTVRDADATDEWMLGPGAIIGDLTAKGKARQLIGVNDFVVVAY